MWRHGGARVAAATASATATQSRSFGAVPSWVDDLRAAQAADRSTAVSYDIAIDDDMFYEERPYSFDPKIYSELSSAQRAAFCSGDTEKPYVCIGSAFLFPDWADSPVVNDPSHPAKLYWDPSSPSEKVLVQLGPHVPPALWLPIKPSHEAVKRLFRDFSHVDAVTMERYIGQMEKMQSEWEETSDATLADKPSFRASDHFKDQLRFGTVDDLRRDYPRSATLYVGTVDHPSAVERRMAADPPNPCVFSWPLLQASNEDNLTPKFSAFRTVYSKSTIVFTTRQDLAPDSDRPEGLSACTEAPVFAHIVYPDMPRMSGGKNLIRRFNDGFQTDYPEDVPVDLATGLWQFVPQGPHRLTKKFDRMVEGLPSAALGSSVDARRHAGAISTAALALAGVGAPSFERAAELLARRPEPQLRLAAAAGWALAGRDEEYAAVLAAEQDEEAARAMESHRRRTGARTMPFELQEHTLATASVVTNPEFGGTEEEIEAAAKAAAAAAAAAGVPTPSSA